MLSPSVYSNYIEINLGKNSFDLVDLNVGNQQLSGNFDYEFSQKEQYEVFLLEGENLILEERELGDAKLRITKKGNILFIDELKLSEILGQGSIDLEKRSFRFDFQGSWQEDSNQLSGKIDLDFRAWGGFDSFLVSGTLVVSDGIYEDFIFEKIRCNFLGTPPVFSFTDVEVVVPGRGVFELTGELDIRDPENFFPSAEFVSQKLLVEGWQSLGSEEKVGLKRQIGDRFDIKVEAEAERERGAELRYSLEKDNFLKLRTEERETIFGIERRREF